MPIVLPLVSMGSMVIVITNNTYSITLLSGTTKLLTLGKQCFKWTVGPDQRQYLQRISFTKPNIKPAYKGNYWLFDVIDKPGLTPGVHLSIVVAPDEWEAFILRPGLPSKVGESCTIETTPERIAHPNHRQHREQTEPR